MAEPPGQRPAARSDRGHLRASHADRDHVVSTLKVGFVQGRLTKDELDLRVSQALTSRTYADLAALTADLPPGLITAPRPRQVARAQARSPLTKAAVGAAVIIPAPAFLAAALITDSDPLFHVALIVVFVSFMTWIVAGVQMIDNWLGKHPRGQLPPRPAQGGQAPGGEQTSGPGTDLTLCQSRRGYPRPSRALA
jgi:DUF1707 SHOCT-like domain